MRVSPAGGPRRYCNPATTARRSAAIRWQAAQTLAVLEVMETEDICERAAVLAEILIAGFTSRLATLDGVVEIRNKGLMIGIELETPCGSLVKQALEGRSFDQRDRRHGSQIVAPVGDVGRRSRATTGSGVPIDYQLLCGDALARHGYFDVFRAQTNA